MADRRNTAVTGSRSAQSLLPVRSRQGTTGLAAFSYLNVQVRGRDACLHAVEPSLCLVEKI